LNVTTAVATFESGSAAERTRRLVLTLSTMMAILLYAIDMTVANVALPVLQGNLAATREQAAWVLTSYLIASASALPALAAVEARLGLRRSFMIAVLGFGISSVLCGLAPNVESLVLARFLQGMFGAGLLPLGQTALQSVYPPQHLSRAFALLGMGVMVGPILGPSVGGWLTEEFGWRAVFYINLPFVVIALIGLSLTLRGNADPAPRPFDRLGFVLLALTIVPLQLALDRGQQLDWFESAEIVIEVAVGLIAAWMFAVHVRTTRTPLFTPVLGANRNLMISIGMSLLVGWPFMGGMVLLPQFLQEVQGYSVVSAGLLLAPRGVGLMFGMMLVGRVGGKVDPRLIFSVGCVLLSSGLFALSFAPSDAPAAWLTGWLMWQGVGLGFVFVPLNTLGFATLDPRLRTEAAALLTLARNLGSSIGIAVLVSRVTHDASFNVQRLLEAAHFTPQLADGATLAWFIDELRRESLVLSYSNQHVFLCVLPLVILPIVWLTSRPRFAAA
jgi:DHA2 family multidrug resistance protein